MMKHRKTMTILTGTILMVLAFGRTQAADNQAEPKITRVVMTCPAKFVKEMVESLPILTNPSDPSSAKPQEWTHLVLKDEKHEFKLVWAIPHLITEPVKLTAGEAYTFTVTTRRKDDGSVDKEIVTEIKKDGKVIYEKDISTVK